MLIEVFPNLLVGDMEGCGIGDGATLHLCKSPCHQLAVGYKGNLDKQHPEYLIARRGDDLALNMIDAPEAKWFRHEIFTAALDFLDEYAGVRKLAHCNSGLSRAPSIAALWLAKRAKAIPGKSWADAKAAFLVRMPTFSPNAGIDQFLTENWAVLA